MDTNVSALVQQLIDEALASEKVPLAIPDQVAGTLQELVILDALTAEQVELPLTLWARCRAAVLGLRRSQRT